MKRLHKDEYFLALALIVSQRATCVRRQVGCVLVDAHGHIKATGYNGVPRGTAHCIDQPCSAAKAKSGTSLDKCRAVHAEINALIQCSDAESIDTIYLTCSPCVQCLKALMNTSAKRLVFIEAYHGWQDLQGEWTKSNRTWERVHDQY